MSRGHGTSGWPLRRLALGSAVRRSAQRSRAVSGRVAAPDPRGRELNWVPWEGVVLRGARGTRRRRGLRQGGPQRDEGLGADRSLAAGG